jgi:uncharacterized membrane protein (UPF0127 family)
LKQVIARNLTTGAVIAPNTSVADSPWPRFKGLMLRGPLAEGEALLIQPCNSVHMFFMRIALDIVFLDKEGAVVKVVSGLKPWRMALGGKGAHTALELASGAASGISVGDRLVFEPSA